DGAALGSATGAALTVAVFDPKTVSDPRLQGVRVGGDIITVTGGGPGGLAGSAFPGSPLVVYGATSQDGLWYSGNPDGQSIGDFGTKPFPAQLGGGSPHFFFPLANPFDYFGNDVIDASALFAGVPNGQLPSVGLTVYGGVGDDTISGSQAGDHLAGGSGDDTIIGERGVDHIYGDSGVNVDVI